MKTAIGTTSASAAKRVAKVWNRNDPTPIAPRIATRRRATGISASRLRRHITNAAIRKAAFVTAFSGSAQNPGSVRSQYPSIDAAQST